MAPALPPPVRAHGFDPIGTYPSGPFGDPAFIKQMQSTGFHSGIVLLPAESYGPEGPQRFPLSPSW